MTPAIGATTRLFFSWYGPMRMREVNETLLRHSCLHMARADSLFRQICADRFYGKGGILPIIGLLREEAIGGDRLNETGLFAL